MALGWGGEAYIGMWWWGGEQGDSGVGYFVYQSVFL